MSLGLVVLEEKLFTRMRTATPQSDDIKIGAQFTKSKLHHYLGHLSAAGTAPPPQKEKKKQHLVPHGKLL